MKTTIVDPKLIFKELLKTFRCTSFIMFHNHPSNNAIASEQDEYIHEKITNISEILDFRLVDNLIVCDYGYYSFADKKTTFL